MTQEEEADQPYADIVTALNILSNIMTSEFESFSMSSIYFLSRGRQVFTNMLCEDRLNGATAVQGSPDVADVVFFGINLLIPNINMEMLKVSFESVITHDNGSLLTSGGFHYFVNRSPVFVSSTSS